MKMIPEWLKVTCMVAVMAMIADVAPSGCGGERSEPPEPKRTGAPNDGSA